MAEEIELEKCNFWNFTDAVTLTLNRVIRHTLINLYVHTKFHWNWTNFLWTDGGTYCQTDIFPSNVFRSTQRSRPRNVCELQSVPSVVVSSVLHQQWVAVVDSTAPASHQFPYLPPAPCIAFQSQVIMVALWNRAAHYIFILSFVLLLSFFFPRLISAVTEWMSAILAHMVWP